MARLARIGRDYYETLKKIAAGEKVVNNFFEKALTYDGANTGADFIPEEWSADIIQQIYEEGVHRKIYNTWIMGAIKQNVPKFSSRWVGQYISAAITSTDPANQLPLQSTASSTTEIELELKTLTINMMVENKFLTYNASPQIEEKLRSDIIDAMVETELAAIINGDDSATHQDSDTHAGAANLAEKAFKGLRKLATGTSVDASAGQFEYGDFNKMLRNGGRYFKGRAKDLVCYVSPAVAEDIRNFEQIVTLEKYGPNAVILTGEIGKVLGTSIVETDIVREDLNATGVYDGVTTNLTIAILHNPKMCMLGVPKFSQRALSLKVWDDPRFDRQQLIVLEDIAFNVEHPESIVKAINISTA